MNAIEKFNEAFGFNLRAPDVATLRAMAEYAGLRGRKDIATELERHALSYRQANN